MGWGRVLALCMFVSAGGIILTAFLAKIYWIMTRKNKVLASFQPSQATALYNFEGENPDELQFQKGETILVIEKLTPTWWLGELVEGPYSGMQGVFPANFVVEQSQKN